MNDTPGTSEGAGRGPGRHRRLMRLARVVEDVDLSPSTIYDMAAKGRFPRPIKISARASAWIEDEVQDWIEAKIAGRDWSAS